MKNILNKIYIHPLFLISIFIFTLMGYFRLICYFMLLIIIHEIGHIIVGTSFKWNIDKIILLPFGCITKFNTLINKPLVEEFLVSISGILFQVVFYLLIKNSVDYKYFSFINCFIIIFNLIPIYPLDGSKVLNVFFNIITNYKTSILLTVIVSYIFIIMLLVLLFKINKLIFLIIVFLYIEVNKLYKDRKQLFNKFLLERYLKKIKFKHKKIIDNIYKMKKDYNHIFYIDDKYFTESYILKKMFDIKNNL